MKKKILNLALAFALIMSTAIGLVACGKKDDSSDNKSNAVTYVNLDINPEIELIVDSDNKVVSVRAENDDGLILLFESTGIEGENIEKAVEKIITLAKNYGYIGENNNVIGTIISSSDESLENSIKNKINSTISSTAKNLGLTIKTDAEGAYSLLKKFNEFKANHQNNQTIQNLNITKFKLALAVSENGEISLETAVTLDDEKLINMILEISINTEEYATVAFKKAKAEAYANFDYLVYLQSYSCYTTYYTEHILSHPTTAYYGAVYEMYAVYAKALESLCGFVELSSSIDDYTLPNEINLDNIATILKINDIAVLNNADGNITIKSIEEYADKYFKNTPASTELENKKTELTTALNALEEAIKSKAQEEADKCKTQLSNVLVKSSSLFSNIDLILKALPESLQTAISSITSDLNSTIEELDNMVSESGHIDAQKLRTISINLNNKANEYLEKIKNDIGETEFTQLEKSRIDQINADEILITNCTTSLNNSLISAQNTAKNTIRDWQNKVISSLPTE